MSSAPTTPPAKKTRPLAEQTGRRAIRRVQVTYADGSVGVFVGNGSLLVDPNEQTVEVVRAGDGSPSKPETEVEHFQMVSLAMRLHPGPTDA